MALFWETASLYTPTTTKSLIFWSGGVEFLWELLTPWNHQSVSPNWPISRRSLRTISSNLLTSCLPVRSAIWEAGGMAPWLNTGIFLLASCRSTSLTQRSSCRFPLRRSTISSKRWNSTRTPKISWMSCIITSIQLQLYYHEVLATYKMVMLSSLPIWSVNVTLIYIF